MILCGIARHSGPNARSHYGCLRWAVIWLTGYIVLSVVTAHYALAISRTDPIHRVAKPSFAEISFDIPVSNNSPDSQTRFETEFDIINTVVGNKPFNVGVQSNALSGMDSQIVFIYILPREIKLWWNRERQDIRFGPIRNIVSGGLPYIGEHGSRFEPQLLFTFLIQCPAHIDGQISTPIFKRDLSSESYIFARDARIISNPFCNSFHRGGRARSFRDRVLHVATLLNGSAPQLLGRSPKENRGESQHNGKERCNSLPVFLDEAACARLQKENAVGDTFYKLLLGFGAVVLLYAFLKSIGVLDDPSHKSEKKGG